MNRIAKIASVSAIALLAATASGRAQDITGLDGITGLGDLPGPNNIPGLSGLPGIGGEQFTGGGKGQVVHDPLNYLELALTLKELMQSYIVLKNSYEQLTYTVAALAHPNEGTLMMAPGLLNNAMRLPGSAAAEMPGLNYGGNLSGYGQQFYDQNHYYKPEGDDWTAQEMERRQIATANMQGEAQAGMERAEQRLASLTELEANIPAQPDVQATSALNARINAEHMYLVNEQSNMQRLALLERTQERVDQQRAQQHGREQLDQYHTALEAQAWGN